MHKVFEPIHKNKVPVFPDPTAVAAVKPSVFEHLGRCLRVLIIPGKNTRLSIIDFTGRAYFYLCPPVRRSYRFKMDLIITGAGERPSLGCSIQAFERNIQGMVEPEGIRAKYRPGRITDSGIRQTQAAFDGPEQEDVREIVKRFQDDTRFLPAIFQFGRLIADRHQQLEGKALDGIRSENPGLHRCGLAFP